MTPTRFAPDQPAGDVTTFAHLWRRAVDAHATSPFLIFDDSGRVNTWSYAEFDTIVERVAATLYAAGASAGTAIHVCLANCPAFVAVWLAAARLGAWIVPADPRAAGEELADQIARTSAHVAVMGNAQAAKYPHLTVRGPSVLIVEENASGVSTASALWSETGSSASLEAGPYDRLAVMFTSGTTSAPKGVVLTQALYAFTGRTMAAAAGLEREHRWLVTLPLFHANAQFYCFASAIASGASVALTARFSASRWTQQAQELGATHGSLFAAPIRMILAHTASAPVTLRHAWFAQSLTDDDYEQFAALVGCRPRQLYGMTETGPAVLTDRGASPAPGMTGTPTPGCQVRLGEPSGTVDGSYALEVGGVPGLTLFDSYLDDPTTTAASVTKPDADGISWFATGDWVRRDTSGRYQFAGRMADVAKVGGENVSLNEVEATLAVHPGVHDVVAVAMPDALLDEVLGALVVVRAGREFDGEEFLSWAAQRLAPSKRPRTVHVAADLPRTSVGKIRRFLARALLEAGG